MRLRKRRLRPIAPLFLRKAFFCFSFVVFALFLSAQERFSLVFSEQSYLLNPAFTGLTNQNRASFGAGFQGVGENNFKNLQAALSYYNANLKGGIEFYTVVYSEGLYKHSMVSMQLSRFFHLFGKWSLSLGVAPELHNHAVNGKKVVLESHLAGYSGVSASFPSLWSVGLSLGTAVFTEEHTLGFTVQNLFDKASFSGSQSKTRNYRYIFTAGSNIDLHPFRNQNNKIYLRPHIVIVNQTKKNSFFYGAFYGSKKNQFGMFFVSTTQYPFLGISPAYSLKGKAIKAVFSVKFLYRLPSVYMFGNEIYIQNTW